MSRAKTWAILAGMLAGLMVGPGCMMFDDFCDDECVSERCIYLPESYREATEGPLPEGEARPTSAIP